MSDRHLSGSSSRQNSDHNNRREPASSSSTGKDFLTHGSSSNDSSIAAECKAAYVSVVKGASVDNKLSSKSDLLLGKIKKKRRLLLT